MRHGSCANRKYPWGRRRRVAVRDAPIGGNGLVESSPHYINSRSFALAPTASPPLQHCPRRELRSRGGGGASSARRPCRSCSALSEQSTSPPPKHRVDVPLSRPSSPHPHPG